MPTSPRQYRFRIRFSNGMGNRLVLGRADNIRPYIYAYIFPMAGTSRMAGRPRAASPTIRFRKRHSKGRADNIRPYIYAYVFQTAVPSRTKNVGGDAHIAPPCCYRTGCPKGRDVEDAVPYDSLPHTLSKPPGGRGRPPLQFVSGNVIQKAGRIISAPTKNISKRY